MSFLIDWYWYHHHQPWASPPLPPLNLPSIAPNQGSGHCAPGLRASLIILWSFNCCLTSSIQFHGCLWQPGHPPPTSTTTALLSSTWNEPTQRYSSQQDDERETNLVGMNVEPCYSTLLCGSGTILASLFSFSLQTTSHTHSGGIKHSATLLIEKNISAYRKRKKLANPVGTYNLSPICLCLTLTRSENLQLHTA